MAGRTRLKLLISSSALAQASIALLRLIARANWIGNEMANYRQAHVVGRRRFAL
jgi:hypothetical protein